MADQIDAWGCVSEAILQIPNPGGRIHGELTFVWVRITSEEPLACPAVDTLRLREALLPLLSPGVPGG